MIVCIGDSITAGQYLDPPDVPWPVLLDHGTLVFPAGVSNETTRQGLERFRLVHSTRPGRSQPVETPSA